MPCRQRLGELRDYTVTFQTENGEALTLQRECYHRGDAAAVLPFNRRRGTVLLVRQLRLGALLGGDNPFILEAPAGGLDGESPERCAEKEAMEETGCRIFNLQAVAQLYAMPAAATEKVYLFLADYDEHPRKTAGLAEEGEFIDVVELTVNEALDMIASNTIIDMKTVVLLQTLALREKS